MWLPVRAGAGAIVAVPGSFCLRCSLLWTQVLFVFCSRRAHLLRRWV